MKIKVLHCIHSLYGGGAERQLTLLGNHINSSSMEFAVLIVDQSLNGIVNTKTPIFTLKNQGNYPWGMIQEVIGCIERYKPDVVHVWLPPSVSVPALIAAKIKGVRTVSAYRNKKIFELWIRWPEFFSILFFSDGIASNNPPEQSSLLFRWLYTWKRGVVISNAVFIPDEIRRLKQAHEKQGDVFNILFVGRLTYQKNWKTLLLALSKLSAISSWHLRICGKGEEECQLREETERLGLVGRISMLGYRTDVYSLMAESDLLVLPSWYEGMPNVVLEALAIGLPAVVSKITAHESLFGDRSGVLMFDPKDVDELAIMLRRVVTGEIDLNDLSDKGRNFASDYTPERLLGSYERYYRSVLKEG